MGQSHTETHNQISYADQIQQDLSQTKVLCCVFLTHIVARVHWQSSAIYKLVHNIPTASPLAL